MIGGPRSPQSLHTGAGATREAIERIRRTIVACIAVRVHTERKRAPRQERPLMLIGINV